MISGSGTAQPSTPCGSSFFSALPEDVFAFVSGSLTPMDVCTLSLCCRNLNTLATSDKVWLAQCESVGIVGSKDLLEWRKGVLSYKSLCKFLFSVKPLMGIWVHQNPELGNVVYVMPGFVSVVGCRIIPQELGPLGIDDGPLLWAPVFEIIGDTDGSTAFFLHGRERDCNYLYPGRLKSVDKNCTVLLLEVEPKQKINGESLLHSETLVHCNSDREFSRRIYRPDRGTSRSQRVPESPSIVPFYNLGFGDRRKLLELVADHVCLKAPNLANGLLFPPLRDDDRNFQNDVAIMSKRRSLLMKIYKFGEGCANLQELHRVSSNPIEMELKKIKKTLDRPNSCPGPLTRDEVHSCRSPKRRTVASYFMDRLKLILGRSSPVNGSREVLRCSSSSRESKHSKFQEFLKSADTMGMTLSAKSVKLLTYRAWPNMHENHFALYKLPTPLPVAGQEYAGLWGGTFGWPPGRPTDDKPGKALFFLSLSYEESEGRRLLLATKILEGTHYVLHPNGSAMFVAKVDEMSSDTFPWSNDGGVSLPADVKYSYNGEGIAHGYGFRYPGSKPGSLFVIRDGLLAFVWKESRAVLTLQRLNLQELLKKGERVLALPPIVNFAYLTKSYSNVFTGFSSTVR